MTVEQIRAKYWKLNERLAGIPRTIDRDLQIFIVEMVAEVAAQLAQLNETMDRTVGLLNAERIALECARLMHDGVPVIIDQRQMNLFMGDRA